MHISRIALVFCCLFLLFAPLLSSQTSVLTRSYDDGRTGANTTETVLTPQVVATKGLRKFKSMKVDDLRVEAQPLYVPQLLMQDGKTHNVVFVASMANTLWAFDADAPEGQDLLWKTSLGKPLIPPETEKPGQHRSTAVDFWGINIAWGILSTPVIDIDAKRIYVVNWMMVGSAKNPALFLHAVSLKDGKELASPVPVTGQLTDDRGQPVLDANNRPVTLEPDQKQRAALLLVPLHGQHKTLFAAVTGGEHPGDPHGWMVAFDVDSFAETASWPSTQKGFGGGIWEGSQGPAADEDGNVYAMTGNGGYATDIAGHTVDFEGDTDFAEAFVKLKYSEPGSAKATLTLADWFIAFRDSQRTTQRNYDYRDQDLGSASPVVPPGSGLILGAGKDGLIYVLDRSNLGKKIDDFSVLKSPPIYVTYNGIGLPSTGDIDFPLGDPSRNPSKTHHLHGSPVYWNGSNGPMIFTWGENESLRAWRIDVNTGKLSFVARGAEVASADLAASPTGLGGMTGGMVTLSSNGATSNTGIVWATAPLSGDANHAPVPGIVRAYDATELDATPIDAFTPRLK